MFQLDSKKSPLALLAQTCSQIGADSNSKSLLSQIDKNSNKKNEPSREKSSPSSVTSCSPAAVKSSFKPYESCVIKSETTSEEKRPKSSSTKSHSTLNLNGSRCSSKDSASSHRSASSPSSRKTPGTTDTSTRSPTNFSQSSLFSRTSEPLSLKKSEPPTSSPFLGYPGSLPLDVLASNLMKQGGMNPYLNYSRLKTTSGSESLVPVCRDPFCTGCQLNSHLLGPSKGKCPPGCTQCEKGSPYLPPGHHNSTMAAAYAHAQLSALVAASQLPYVCSWVGGDASYCGKRYSNSDELLQHLRTHTTDSLLNPSYLPLLGRSYPNPPLSPVPSARYHPYSKPPLLPPSLASSFPLPPPGGIPPYFSPYSLYGPRLGASHP